MAGVVALAARLVDASARPDRDPYADIAWPATRDAQAWYFSPELVSLHGTAAWDALDAGARRELAFREAVNFCSLNVHGETRLIAGLDAIAAARHDDAVAAYLHCFRAEEAKHRDAFVRFCTHFAGAVYPDRSVALAPAWDGEDAELLFFARVLVFEEFVDQYNAVMARDARLAPVARQLNRAHHLEESRHLAFGRAWLAQLAAEGHARWRADEAKAIALDLADFRRALWRDLFCVQAWRDAGLADAGATNTDVRDAGAIDLYALRLAVLADPLVQAREQAAFAGVARFLRGLGLCIDGVAA
jgi:hypothetical protein